MLESFRYMHFKCKVLLVPATLFCVLLYSSNIAAESDYPFVLDRPSCVDITQEVGQLKGNIIEVFPAQNGMVRASGRLTTLRALVRQAAEGSIIGLNDGTYSFEPSTGENYTGVYVTKPNITLKGLSGDAAKVVLDSSYIDHGDDSSVITVAASNFTLANLTVRRSVYHLVHLWKGADHFLMHNVNLENGGQQFLKKSPGKSVVANGRVSCSRFVMDDEGRDNVWGYGAPSSNTICYTGGIDAHNAINWIISDNYFEGIYCEKDRPHPQHAFNGGRQYFGGLSEHAIHIWHAQKGTTHIIERNIIRDCARGIGIGTYDDPKLGKVIIRNNMITSNFERSREHDVGIIVEGASNSEILHNSIFYNHPRGYAHAIEYRYKSTNVSIMNNLTNRAIRRRDGATGKLEGNVTYANKTDFVAPNQGDLHLSNCEISGVDNAVSTNGKVHDDIDGQLRQKSRTDVGADECYEITPRFF